MDVFFQELKEMKETLTNLKNYNEERRNEYTECLKEICELKESNLKQCDEIAKLHREIARLKGENDVVHEQMETLYLRQPDEGKETTAVKGTASLADKPDLFDKKLTRTCLKVREMERTVGDLTGQMKDMKKEVAAVKSHNRPRTAEQRDPQSQLDSDESSAIASVDPTELTPLPVPVQPPSAVGQHPSKTAAPISRMKNRNDRRNELKKDSNFNLTAYPAVNLEPKTPAWIGNYTSVKKDCNFMCPESGVYTTPVEGYYNFSAESPDCSSAGRVNIYLCRLSDKKRELLLKGETNGLYEKEWRCDENEKVWTEVMLVQGSCNLTYFRFSGVLL